MHLRYCSNGKIVLILQRKSTNETYNHGNCTEKKTRWRQL